jgi:hypothetical protein
MNGSPEDIKAIEAFDCRALSKAKSRVLDVEPSMAL